MNQKKLSYERTLFCDKNAEVIGISETEAERERDIFSAIKIVTDETVLILEAFNQGVAGFDPVFPISEENVFMKILPKIQLKEHYNEA